MQKRYHGIEQLSDILEACKPQKTLLVCDSAFAHLPFGSFITQMLQSYVVFDGFCPNPLYQDVISGVQLLNKNGCDLILAVGGGSAIDVAKCIKLLCKMDLQDGLEGEYQENGIPLVAIPTTAGTGSESTRFAVIYQDGEKQSVCHDGILPGYVILEHHALRTLPLYQKKCTMLDALCQAIESWWSVNSTEESRRLSAQAVKLMVASIPAYLQNTDLGHETMLSASNLAGQAIHITQTTAPHAMSYKLTSLYGIPHGHAVSLCLPAVWRYMLEQINQCTDPRDPQHVNLVFAEIAGALGCGTPEEAIGWFDQLLVDLQITSPEKATKADLELLAGSVNPTRLKNNPVSIDYAAAKALYTQILNLKEKEQ